jgi:hypothetical protein
MRGQRIVHYNYGDRMEEAPTTIYYPSYDDYVERWNKSGAFRSRCNVQGNGMENSPRRSPHQSGVVTRFDDHGVIRLVMMCINCKGILVEDPVLV